MSSSVSQLEYWREPNKPNVTNATNAKEGGPGAMYLSYDVFMALSILGGALALDHLYLRSPLTFLAKLIVNILTLGMWWLYDASQAVFNRDVVKVFGLGVPGLGPKGIAAGVLGNDVPDKKHMAFFLYSVALIFGGIFGLDSFVVGDKQSGFIRLVCLITGIFAPIAIFWWLFNLGKFFFKTKDVTSLYWEYFGAPKPAEYGMTVAEKLAMKIPFLQTIIGPIKRTTNVVEAIVDNPTSDTARALKPVLNAALEPVAAALQTAAEPLIQVAEPFKETANSALSVAQSGFNTVKEGIALGRNVLDTGAAMVGKTLNVVDDTAKAATQALTLAPAAAALTSGFTPMAAASALQALNATNATQKGGSNSSNVLPFMLMGTLAVIAVSGFILTYRRSRQNERPRKDDPPPNPETPISRVL